MTWTGWVPGDIFEQADIEIDLLQFADDLASLENEVSSSLGFGRPLNADEVKVALLVLIAALKSRADPVQAIARSIKAYNETAALIWQREAQGEQAWRDRALPLCALPRRQAEGTLRTRPVTP